MRSLGGVYLQAARNLPSEGTARHMVLMESSQTQGRLAEDMLAERAILNGEDLGPGGGPGRRYQSPGLPCSSCSGFSLFVWSLTYPPNSTHVLAPLNFACDAEFLAMSLALIRLARFT